MGDLLLRVRCGAGGAFELKLLGKLEQWGINKGSKVKEVKLSTSQLTGAQLEHLLKNLPDGVTYSLDLDKEQ